MPTTYPKRESKLNVRTQKGRIIDPAKPRLARPCSDCSHIGESMPRVQHMERASDAEPLRRRNGFRRRLLDAVLDVTGDPSSKGFRRGIPAARFAVLEPRGGI